MQSKHTRPVKTNRTWLQTWTPCAVALTLSVLGSAGQATAPPILQGNAATAQLKEQGHYESLMQALQVAHYAVETVEAERSTAQGSECYAGNPAHALRCWFRAGGLELQPAGTKQSPWTLKLRLRDYGRATLAATGVGQVSAWQNRVELSRANGAVVEWYENKPAGLEQGFTVLRAPQGDGSLRLILEVEGDLRPELESGNTAVKFVAADGQATLRYSGLKAWDGAQCELAAHLEVQGRQLALVVNDRDAAYPVTIDPLITWQEAQLTAGDGSPEDFFGYSVSLSSDGNTALVGSHFDDTPPRTDAGSAFVFVRSGSSWSLQAKLTASDAAASDVFGCSVSLNGDGNTALVGAFRDDTTAGTDAGSAYVFVRSGNSWSEQAKLTAADAATSDNFGNSVSISSDGNTALVGAYQDDLPSWANAGSAYVFVRDGTSWSQQAKLTAADPNSNDYFGYSVALSGDGNLALSGTYQDDQPGAANAGSAYVFVRSGSTWSQQTRLTASDGAADDYFGFAVSLNSDGTTALVGAQRDSTTVAIITGSAYVFVRNGTNWSQQTQLMAADGALYDYFGSTVSLNSDGNTALIGAPYDDTTAGTDAGSAYVFVRDGTSWSQQIKLRDATGAASDRFGNAVALSSDGLMALVGASWDDTTAGTNAGSVSVFLRSGANWNRQAQLTAGDGSAGDALGRSVSLSSDGSTALVGACLDDTAAGTDAGSAFVFVRNGSCWSPQAKLTASDGAATDEFGISVSLSRDGNTALVGAFFEDTPAANAGSAYVFVRSGSSWSQQAKLTAADGAVGDYFGCSVSLSGDGNTALVGAYNDDTPAGANAGSAYVFVRSGSSWSQLPKLVASDGAANDGFGSSVSLSGDGATALVGAGGDDTSAMDAGSAYVFVWDGSSWSQQGKLTAADGALFDHFGYSVSVSSDGSTALVGSHFDDTPAGTDAGSAYVFVRSDTTWGEQTKLTAADAAADDSFGFAVSLTDSGDVALVGVMQDDTTAGSNAGSAYVFVRSGTTWNQQAKLTANDGAASDYFGNSVSLSSDGSKALVGASQDDTTAGIDAGSAYVFRLPELAEGYNRLAVEVLGGDEVRLTYLGLAGTNYALDRTFNLMPTVDWVPQATNPAAADGYLILTNTPDSTTNNFWRMRSVP